MNKYLLQHVLGGYVVSFPDGCVGVGDGAK